MRAIVLAGGLGTRLRPLTDVLPKPLLPVDEMPILEIILRQLRAAGVDHVTLALHYKADLVQRMIGDGSQLGLRVDYSVSEERLGTAGPLSLIPRPTGSCVVLNADILTDLDFADLIASHQESGCVATVVLTRHEQDIPFGVADTDGQARLAGYQEKPTVGFLVNAGIYAIEPEAWEKFVPGVYLDVPDLIRRALASGVPLNAYAHGGRWIDIGTVESFERASQAFRASRATFLREPTATPADPPESAPGGNGDGRALASSLGR